MKIFALLTLVCIFIAGIAADSVTYGVIGRSRLLDQTAVKHDSKFLRIVDEIVEFPAKGHVNWSTLDAVQVVDLKKKDGGIVYLVKGGPGYRNATLRLKSDRGHGLDYRIYFYGN